MSRSNYSDDFAGHECVMYRGAVASATNGRRGQAFLREMLAALDAMPERKLVQSALEEDGNVCAIGAVGKARGVDMTGLDPECSEAIAETFGIADALAREIVFWNDEGAWPPWPSETPEARFDRMRAWVVSQIRKPAVANIKEISDA